MEPAGPIKVPPKRPAVAMLARYLLALDGTQAPEPEETCMAAEEVYRRLRTRLVVSLGALGFDALWERALQIALRQAAHGDSTLVPAALASGPPGLRELVRDYDRAATLELLVAVLTSFFTLLVTFIGEHLTFRMLYQLWPTLPTGETDPPPAEKEDAHDGV